MKNRKEEIIRATLELAATHGLGSVSMSMIAEKIGIRKASLYNHFTARDEIVEAMYQYLRNQAKEKSNMAAMSYEDMFAGRGAIEVLQMVVDNYIRMNLNGDMEIFYKVIYSERCISPMAAKIMAEETAKMIEASRQLFVRMQGQKLLHFRDIDQSAANFALTIHGIIDYEMDQKIAGDEQVNSMMDKYLEWFCNENSSDL